MLPSFTVPRSAPAHWISRAGNVRGPYPWVEIERMVAQGVLRADDGCSTDRQHWVALGAMLRQKNLETPDAGHRFDSPHPVAVVAGIVDAESQAALTSIAPVELAALQDDLIASILAEVKIEHPRYFAESDIPQAIALGARRYCVAGAERLLAVYDGSDSGTSEEGFAITARGVSWRLASQPSENMLAAAPSLAMLTASAGKRAPLVGSMAFRQMPGRPLTAFDTDEKDLTTAKLQFGSVSAACLPECDEATLEALADFLAEAAAIAQRRSPRLALAEAKLLAKRGGEQAAVELCRQAIAADPRLASDVLAIVEEHARTLSNYRDELSAMQGENAACYFVRRFGGRVSGPLAYESLCSLASESKLLADDEFLRFGDREWRSTSDLPGALGNCFRDGGRATDDQTRAALEALAEAGSPIGELVLLCASQETRWLGISAEGPLVVTLPANAQAKPRVDRDHWESAIWRLTPAKGTARPAKLDLSLASGEFQCTFASGRGLRAIEECARRLFVERAKAACEGGEFLLAEKLLDQASLQDAAEAKELRGRMGKRAQILAVYDGGHPSVSTRTLGALRLDSLGLEFASIVPGDSTRFRLSYKQLREISPPARGALPEEMAKRIAHSERSAQLLKTGLAFGASAIVPGGSLLVNGLMGGKKAEAAPNNRLCIAAAIDGASYRMFFEAVTERREDLDRAAKEFWVAGNGLRKLFGGQAAKSSNATDEQVRLLREIRDLLAQLVGGKNESSPLTKNVGVTIACPKCNQRLRVAAPGAVACAKCGAKLRVAESHFQGVSQ